MKVLRDHPDIGVAGAIYDELSMPMSARSDAPESVVAFNYITQATIDALKNATRGMPRHPFRLALGDNFVSIADVCKETGIVNQMYGKVQMGLDHMVMLRMGAPRVCASHCDGRRTGKHARRTGNSKDSAGGARRSTVS